MKTLFTLQFLNSISSKIFHLIIVRIKNSGLREQGTKTRLSKRGMRKRANREIIQHFCK